MFTLANQHSFQPDTDNCWLSASSGYGNDFSWNLHLQSQSAMTRFCSESFESSFGLEVSPPLGIRNWRDLTGQIMEIPHDLLPCGFMFHCDMSQQWEYLVSLRLRFGQPRGAQIEVFADGRGSVEAEPDIFPEGEVAFQIQTWVTFRGVAINVPLNVSDPLSYSTSRIKSLLPRYAFLPPIFRQTRDNGGVIRVVEALFSPDESVSCA